MDLSTVVVAPLDGKGLGVLAVHDIASGQRIIREQPLLRLTPDGEGRYDGRYYGERDTARERLIALAQDVCGKCGAKADALTKVIETNGIIVEDGKHSVVFQSVSRLNHSCAPNCQFRWDPALEEGSVHTLLPIVTGEECVFNYLGHTAPPALDERRALLLTKFGFDCRCSRCTAGSGR